MSYEQDLATALDERHEAEAAAMRERPGPQFRHASRVAFADANPGWAQEHGYMQHT
jgi:hypothetical protein